MKKPLLFIAMLIGVSAFAQNSYTLSTYTSSYTELTNATLMEEFDVDDDSWDDPFFTVPFGFNFAMNDQTYPSTSQVDVGAFFLFGDLFSGEQQGFGLIDDITDGDNIEGLPSSEISYTVDGVPGSQIAKVQYMDAAFYDEVFGNEPAAENRMDFQLWFYEDGGILEVHFGASNIPNPELVFFGNAGPSIVVGLGVEGMGTTIEYGAAITGDPSNPSLAVLETTGEDPPGLGGMPENGRVYRLTPATPVGLFDAKAPEFSIYPTITESELWVKGETNAKANYRIMDITGKEVLAGRMQNQNAINVSNLNSGVYLFSIDGMSSAAKFIKK